MRDKVKQTCEFISIFFIGMFSRDTSDAFSLVDPTQVLIESSSEEDSSDEDSIIDGRNVQPQNSLNLSYDI